MATFNLVLDKGGIKRMKQINPKTCGVMVII